MCRPFLLFLVYFKSYICSVYLDMVYQGELSNILTKMYNAKLINTAINSFPVLKYTFKKLEKYVNHYFLWWDIINTFILFSWPYVVRFRVWFSFFLVVLWMVKPIPSTFRGSGCPFITVVVLIVVCQCHCMSFTSILCTLRIIHCFLRHL